MELLGECLEEFTADLLEEFTKNALQQYLGISGGAATGIHRISLSAFSGVTGRFLNETLSRNPSTTLSAIPEETSIGISSRSPREILWETQTQ